MAEQSSSTPSGLSVSSPPIIWIRAPLIPRISDEASEHYPLETGGILLGYRAEREWVVTDLLSAGPKAVRAHGSFTFDHEWERQGLERRFAESGGSEMYLGDWHSHPDGGLRVSHTDRHVLRRIIESDTASTPEPVCAILAGRPGGWDFGAWTARLGPRGLLGARLSLAVAAIQQFGTGPPTRLRS